MKNSEESVKNVQKLLKIADLLKHSPLRQLQAAAHTDVVAHLELRHLAAHLLHHTRQLVARHAGVLHLSEAFK